MNLPVVACFAPRTPMLHTGLNYSSSDTNRRSTLVFTASKPSRNTKPLAAVSSDSVPDPESNLKPKKEATESENFPTKVPRKPKRGRRSEADAVEDFVRSSLEKTFSTIREQNPEVFENKENFIKDRADQNDDEEDDEIEEEMVVEEEDPDWPVDTDVGWGIKASEYFDTHPIKNVVGEDGAVIDWEGEIDDSWVKEINCLEWESFAFHPSPLVVLVFERYKRASDNWKTLKELEKAIKVYWDAKDRLPPRAVKIDLNIETDLAYALKAKECPQILFLRGNRILYREKEFRTADELVQMIAHFYYKARRPSWVDKANVTPYC
ncbi:Thioredoxin-like fold domain-containing protein MRL7 [Hirschfeldia incana]|nr:Thioredoxin-like fold domain-containing protein MRL7 [Hirschfeldia incana]